MEAVLAVTYPLLRLADFRGAGRCPLAKTGALRQPCLRCFVRRTRSARLLLWNASECNAADAPFWRSEEHTLNSSHVSNSYAVFCLKKKIDKNQLRT